MRIQRTNRQNAHVGRKPISKSGEKRVALSVTVTPAVRELLEAQAREREIPVSQLVMEILAAWSKQQGQP